ncbi:MAG: sporulation integral membrane protein YtvI [Clostridia bacterium]|nr:sporulation integral membrane protein YtvI [Clostridia bacterium]MDD4375648.1 sporulation integral membrane protein YtvI [Clostridia bacterium]
MVDYKKTTIKIIGLIGISALVLTSIGLAVFFWPFLIAIAVALLLEKIVEGIVKKTKISRKLIGTILVLLVYATIGFIVYLLIARLIKESMSISIDLPSIFDYAKDNYDAIYNKYFKDIDMPEAITTKAYEIGMDLLGTLFGYINKFFNGIVNFIMFMPSLLIYIIITLLATLFLVTDRRILSRYIHDILPKKFVRKISNIFKETIISLSQYLKAQLILLCITFVELLIAFLILKLDYPFTLAIVIALVDALPILGTGTILIPWGIYSAVMGDMTLAIGLLTTYVIILIVRQLIEPRIVSSNLGVHPFITLISMYIAFKIFGLVGLIIGPVVMVIFRNVFAQLFEHGYMKNLVVYKKEQNNKLNQ